MDHIVAHYNTPSNPDEFVASNFQYYAPGQTNEYWQSNHTLQFPIIQNPPNELVYSSALRNGAIFYAPITYYGGDVTDFNPRFIAGDFTCEASFRQFGGPYPFFTELIRIDTNTGGFVIVTENNDAIPQSITVNISGASTTVVNDLSSKIHISVQRIGATGYVHFNGVLIHTAALAGDVSNMSIGPNVTIDGSTGLPYPNGTYCDEFRFIDQAMYGSGTFTPPSGQFSDPVSPPINMPTAGGQFGSGGWINTGAFEVSLPKLDTPPDMSTESDSQIVGVEEKSGAKFPWIFALILGALILKGG